jgi:hypothetical protein
MTTANRNETTGVLCAGRRESFDEAALPERSGPPRTLRKALSFRFHRASGSAPRSRAFSIRLFLRLPFLREKAELEPRGSLLLLTRARGGGGGEIGSQLSTLTVTGTARLRAAAELSHFWRSMRRRDSCGASLAAGIARGEGRLACRRTVCSQRLTGASSPASRSEWSRFTSRWEDGVRRDAAAAQSAPRRPCAP